MNFIARLYLIMNELVTARVGNCFQNFTSNSQPVHPPMSLYKLSILKLILSF